MFDEKACRAIPDIPPDCRLLAANYIIVGSLGKASDRFILNTRLIVVETGETLRTASDRYSSMGDLIEGSEAVVTQLMASAVAAGGGDTSPAAQPQDRRIVRLGGTITMDGADYKRGLLGGYPELLTAVLGAPGVPNIVLTEATKLVSNVRLGRGFMFASSGVYLGTYVVGLAVGMADTDSGRSILLGNAMLGSKVLVPLAIIGAILQYQPPRRLIAANNDAVGPR